MRLWSLHPRYLDSKGLVALWREALLAQHVLAGKTTGYRNHPQLDRFKAHADPLGAIAAYLQAIHTEAACRDYHFNREKIMNPCSGAATIPVTTRQLAYEMEHLKQKLHQRNPDWLSTFTNFTSPDPHPLFTVIQGNIETWERR